MYKNIRANIYIYNNRLIRMNHFCIQKKNEVYYIKFYFILFKISCKRHLQICQKYWKDLYNISPFSTYKSNSSFELI